MKETERRTWAEISLSHLDHNYRALRAMLPQGCRFLGVVKANAYGHGAIPIARRLEALGADYLAVACLDEAAELRGAGISLPILILGVTPTQYADDLIRLEITQAVGDLDTARALSAAAVRAGRPLNIHIKVDTGMARLGFLCDGTDVARTAAEIAEAVSLPGLKAEGIFTHFSDSDGSEAYTMLQFTRFLDLLAALGEGGHTFRIRHCANSAAVLNYPCTHLDLVRPGIALYGHYPAPSCEGMDGPGLKPVMTLKTRVAAVRTVPAGSYVSYGRTAHMAGETTLAVLPVGYADGFSRLLSNEGSALIHGKPCPIVGRVCMDMCMVAVDPSLVVRPGDEAVLYGADMLAVEQAAALVGTIQYELLCAVSPRVPREYLE